MFTPPSNSHELPSTLGDGRYHVMRRLGSGAMASVFEVEDDDGRRYAIKVADGRVAARTDLRARFQAEANLLHRVAHPNVLKVHDAGAGESASRRQADEVDDRGHVAFSSSSPSVEVARRCSGNGPRPKGSPAAGGATTSNSGSRPGR